MNSKAYQEQGIDLKRFVLVMAKKMWILLAALLLGFILGAGLYEIVTSLTNGITEYRVSADYYITFNFDEFEHGDDYYNAYTWDGILRDDPIVDYAMTKLPSEFTKTMVKEAVSGEMLGDYRILTVHATSTDQRAAELIADAYRESLTHFGQSLELFEKIEMWSREETAVLEKNTKTVNAGLLGAVLLGIVTFLTLLYYYLMEDGFYTEKDIRKRLEISVFGIETKGKDSEEEKRLKTNLELLEPGGYITWQAEKVPEKEDWEAMKGKTIILLLPWGKSIGRKAERLLEEMKLHSCKVTGAILTEADHRFLKAYYGGKNAAANISIGGETKTKYFS